MPQRPVSRSGPAPGPPQRQHPRRSTVRYRVSRRHVGSTDQGSPASFGPAPTVYEPGGPVLLADDGADGMDATSLETEAIRSGAVLLVVPAVPGPTQAGELSGPDRQERRIGMSVGPSLIVAE